jgi:hypothetical protein
MTILLVREGHPATDPPREEPRMAATFAGGRKSAGERVPAFIHT